MKRCLLAIALMRGLLGFSAPALTQDMSASNLEIVHEKLKAAKGEKREN